MPSGRLTEVAHEALGSLWALLICPRASPLLQLQHILQVLALSGPSVCEMPLLVALGRSSCIELSC